MVENLRFVIFACLKNRDVATKTAPKCDNLWGNPDELLYLYEIFLSNSVR